MDPLNPAIVELAPTDSRLVSLIEAHLSLMRASSPAHSVHAMEGAELARSGARFFAVFEGNDAVAMGALKHLSGVHAELKSMHVRQDRRGTGLADMILACVMDVARASGFARLSLETGSHAAFLPARRFYARCGFTLCAPIEGYVPDPNSVFMTRAL